MWYNLQETNLGPSPQSKGSNMIKLSYSKTCIILTDTVVMPSLVRDVLCSRDVTFMTAMLVMMWFYNRLILIKTLLTIDVAYFEQLQRCRFQLRYLKQYVFRTKVDEIYLQNIKKWNKRHTNWYNYNTHSLSRTST